MFVTERLGSTTIGTTIPDVIINGVEGAATNRIAGFAQIVHNPSELKTVVDTLAKQEIPSVFADAVLLRRQELNQINEVWDFPLAASVPNTCPLPWTIIEATEKAALNNYKVEYNIMKTLDFNGRNILRIELPEISLYETNLQIGSALSNPKEQARNMFVGAWYRDLIPRIVKQIAIYPRSASHELFTYSGYCIFIHNLIFGNEKKEMNDLMSGEDKFELCYDPYRVESSALGLNSFKGMDVYSSYSTTPVTTGVGSVRDMHVQPTVIGQDGLVDYFQRNDMMDLKEFRDAYAKNCYYEAPIAQNYHVRHSIHSRRVIHAARSIDVPLDILPFAHDLSSALSTAALAGECGYLRISIHEDWLSRSFYCKRISDIAPAHPLVNHLHYELGDSFRYTNPITGAESVGTIGEDGENQMVGWVNVDSCGRFGDSEFIRDSRSTEDNTFNTSNAYSVPGSIVGKNVVAENVIPTKLNIGNGENKDGAVFTAPATSGTATLRTGNSRVTGSVSYNDNAGTFTVTGRNGSAGIPTMQSSLNRDYAANFGNAVSNISNAATANVMDLINSIVNDNTGISDSPINIPLVVINPTYHNQVSNSIAVRLFQIGFQTLDSVSELLTRLPNIYITTEWAEADFPITPLQNMDISINNDLYQMANVFWFIPKDSYGVESMRVYAPHMINHEMPLINLMRLRTVLDQGRAAYDWDMLNVVNPAYMGLNPLIENIGILSFAPEIHANKYPLAYYDPNIAGEIRCTFEKGSNISQNLVGSDRYSVNIRNGTLKVLTIGINGVVSVNLSLFRMVF